MKYFFSLFLLAILLIYGCRSSFSLSNFDQNGSNFENRFFTLDLTKDDSDINKFKSHFFTTFPHDDPTLGNVVYDKEKWVDNDIINLEIGDGLYSYVKFRNDSLGYDSFRFTTKSFYNLNEETKRILFVFKGKMPSEKGMWPAWWLNGSSEDEWTYRDSIPSVTDEILGRYSGIGNYYDTPSSVNVTDWPSGGEIDIIENINGEKFVHNTIHTCPQMCDSEWNNDGVINNCANANSKDVNPGCSGTKYIVDELEGTFACLWETDAIYFYYWENGIDVRSNGGPLSNEPNPESWKDTYLKNSVKLIETDEPCKSELHQSWQCENCSESIMCKFQNLKMIFNVTLCGVWAGNLFDSTDNSFKNCSEYIMNEGIKEVDNQFMKIEYVSIKNLSTNNFRKDSKNNLMIY